MENERGVLRGTECWWSSQRGGGRGGEDSKRREEKVEEVVATEREGRGRKMTIIVILIICKGIVDFHAGQVWPQWRYIMTKTRRVGWVPFARQKARR